MLKKLNFYFIAAMLISAGLWAGVIWRVMSYGVAP